MTQTIPQASAAELAAYLKRIGFGGVADPDHPTLRALHRAHVESIAWENLDLALGRPITRDPRDAFDKIVRRGRGGWCYEMNGLFAWMLEALGFRVTRLAGAVMRESVGDAMIGNHLVLLVTLDQHYVADVGLGTGLIEPVPLAEGRIDQHFRNFALERLEGDWWRFHNHPGAMPPSVDFSPSVTDEALLEDRNHWLQTDPASPFVGQRVVHRYRSGHLASLVNGNVTEANVRGTRSRAIESAGEYAHVLRDTFGITLTEAPILWSDGAERLKVA